jgi:hypothetical protein
MFANLDHIWNPIVISADAVFNLKIVMIVGVACYPKAVLLVGVSLEIYELKILYHCSTNELNEQEVLRYQMSTRQPAAALPSSTASQIYYADSWH